MNPNIPKPNPKPGDSSGEVKIPRQPRPGPLTPRTPGKPGKRPGPLTPRTPKGPGKREKRPLPKPITKPFDLRKEKQLPRKPLNKSGLKKDGPSGKKGSLSMNVKNPILIIRKKIGAR